MRTLIALALAAFAAGCAVTLPVTGQLEHGGETFTGAATGHLGGSGNLRIVSSRGTVCTGQFVYESPRRGAGVFTCDDQRSGPFTFTSAGVRGAGVGTLGGEKFIFTFGAF